MVGVKAEIISKIILKPSSPTPDHLKHFEISFLDQLPHAHCFSIVLFYSASDIAKTSSTHDDHGFSRMSQKLRTSLSEVLTLYYPFCGRIKRNKNNTFIECNDEGVLYLEAKIPSKLSDFFTNESNNSPTPNDIKGLLPLDPNNPKPEESDEYSLIMAIQVSEFGCGSVAIGVCFSHKICDASTAVSFLQAWSHKAIGDESEVAPPPPPPPPPNMEASLVFPPKETDMVDIPREMIDEKNLSTKRFLFSGDSLCRLREEISRGCNFMPTRVEAVTALIWKSAIEAAAIVDTTHQSSLSMILRHVVNIRSRMVPPLPQNTIGNLFLFATSPLLEVDKQMKVELHGLAETVRKTIRQVDADYVSKLQGDANGFTVILESLKEVFLMTKKGVSFYFFSSWASFNLYEVDFGRGKPTWACPNVISVENVVILMPTRSGVGIEAWVTLNELQMIHFENNALLLQFASFDL